MNKRLTSLSIALLALFTSACSVGPNFTEPDAKAPDNWRDLQRVQNPPDDMRIPHAGVPTIIDTNADPDPRWWRGFNDATLNSLIDRAIAGNLDLQSAVLRITGAREQAVAAGAQGLPQVSANASYMREQLGLKGILESQGAFDQINGLGANAPRVRNAIDSATGPVNLFQDGFDASWELDLFGRVRRSVESANAQTQSAVENRNDALVSLEAEVAQTYSQLRGAQLLKQITLAEIDSEQQILDLTREQARVGLTSQSDVQSATAQVGSLQSQLPQFDAQIAQAMNGLAVLTGSVPGALDAELETPGAVPPAPPSVPIGLPSTLARRRPDIRRAESDLHSATAEVGVAVAQMYPDISLTGSVGTRATRARYLAHWSSLFYSVGPSISLPIFEGGALRANVRIAKSQAAEAALQYRSTVLKALQDVDNSLVSYRTDQDRREALTRTVEANRISLQLATDSYRKGLVTFITVLDAERQLASMRQQLAQSTVSVTTDLIAVYKALGGDGTRAQRAEAAFASAIALANSLALGGVVSSAVGPLHARPTASVMKTILLYVLTAIAEIVGCYLPYRWLKEGGSPWLLVPGALSLALFAWLLTLHASAAGRVYAAYGGVYIAVAIMWLWAVERIRPSSWDWAGMAIALVGMSVIAFQPRG